MDRRKFLCAASALTASAVGIPSWLKSENHPGEKALQIIDTHQHLWDIDRFSTGWSKPPLPRNFNMQDYLDAIKDLHIVKSVYMEVAVPPESRHKEALYAIEICRNKKNPTVAAVIAVDPNRMDFREYFEEFKESPYIKGIRYFFEKGEEVISDRVIKNLQYLGSIGKRFDIVVPPKWLSQANELIKLCPDTRFIIDHCGNADPKAFYRPGKPLPAPPEHDPEQWRKNIAEIASHPNVVCKISGIVSRVRNNPVEAEDVAPIINHCLDSFGPDRVMFAGDWPVCLKNMSLASWVNLLKQVVHSRPEADRRKLFYENAAKFYQI